MPGFLQMDAWPAAIDRCLAVGSVERPGKAWRTGEAFYPRMFARKSRVMEEFTSMKKARQYSNTRQVHCRPRLSMPENDLVMS